MFVGGCLENIHFILCNISSIASYSVCFIFFKMQQGDDQVCVHARDRYVPEEVTRW